MCANRDETTHSTQVLVELILEVDERVVLDLVHWTGEAEDGTSKHGTKRRCRSLDGDLLHDGRLRKGVGRWSLLAEEDAKRTGKAFSAEKVVAAVSDDGRYDASGPPTG